MSLAQLPLALSKSIFSYLSVHSSDRLSVAVSCRGILRDVEAFSETELNRISVEHAVDEDWFTRVVRNARIAAPTSSISERFKLRIAYQTHMYSLGADQRRNFLASLSIHPDGTKLLTCGDNAHLDLWDLQNRQYIRSFNVEEFRVKFWYSCTFWRDCAVSHSTDGIIRVWGLDGSCKISHEIETEVGTNLETSCSDEVMWMDVNKVNALDLLTGARRSTPHNIRVRFVTDCWHSYSCKGRLVTLVAYDENYEEPKPEYGIYVLDPSYLGELSRIVGHYHFLKASHDGHVVAARSVEENEESRSAHVDVYHLEGDELVHRHSFEINSWSFGWSALLWDSRLYVEARNTAPRLSVEEGHFYHVEVYNIFSGALERKLESHLLRDGLRSCRIPLRNKKELFCGFDTGRIKAFLVE